MGFLLDKLDIAKLNAQRDVVKNERRQSYDNQPYGRVPEIFSAAMYPKGHPYSWSVIGSMDDLSAASEEDVKVVLPALLRAKQRDARCCRIDFDPAQAKAWIQKYFGDLPKGQAGAKTKRAARQVRRRANVWSMKIACRCRDFTFSGPRSGSRTTNAMRFGDELRFCQVREQRV